MTLEIYSKTIDLIINKAIKNSTTEECIASSFEKILSMGELIDRLTIVNLKLYNLKDEVIKRKEDQEFLAQAAIKDIYLVEERSRLKKAIDEKLIAMINNPAFNPEIKSYGNNFND